MRHALCAAVVGLSAAAAVDANMIGTPVIGSTFDVVIRQGTNDIVNGTFTVPADFRADGYKAITLGSLDATNDIVLKIHVEQPNEHASIIHYYIRTVDPTLPVSSNPADRVDPFGKAIDPIEYWWNLGSRALVDPLGSGLLSVEITGLEMTGAGVYTTGIPVDDDAFSVVYMTNPYGQYFELPGTVAAQVGYAPPRNQAPRLTGQVSAFRFDDWPDPPGDVWDYQFVGTSAADVCAAYLNMNSPVDMLAAGTPYTVFDPAYLGGTGGLADGESPVWGTTFEKGHVGEIGLAHMVFAPDPATIVILLAASTGLVATRRRAGRGRAPTSPRG